MTTETNKAFTNSRLLHAMIRVRDLDRSLCFYVGRLGMKVLRRQEFPEGAFTLVFLGYDDETRSTAIELTYNWGVQDYDVGTGFGHIAVGVADVFAATAELVRAGVTVVRPAGPLKGDPGELIAFVEDPDGYRIELVQRSLALG